MKTIGGLQPGECFDNVRFGELRVQLRQRHMTKVQIAELWRVSVKTTESILARLSKAGKVAKLRRSQNRVDWMLPEEFEAESARAKEAMRRTRKMNRERYREQKVMAADLPIKRRIICAADAPALCVRAPNSVFALGSML